MIWYLMGKARQKTSHLSPTEQVVSLVKNLTQLMKHAWGVADIEVFLEVITGQNYDRLIWFPFATFVLIVIIPYSVFVQPSVGFGWHLAHSSPISSKGQGFFHHGPDLGECFVWGTWLCSARTHQIQFFHQASHFGGFDHQHHWILSQKH